RPRDHHLVADADLTVRFGDDAADGHTPELAFPLRFGPGPEQAGDIEPHVEADWLILHAARRYFDARSSARQPSCRPLPRVEGRTRCYSVTHMSRRPHSSRVLDGPTRAPGRAMLHAVGFTREDFQKPQIGVCSTWSQVTPCNVHIDELSRRAARGVDEAGGKAVIFNTITVSDGISMGTEGMKYSLVSREIIADSIETVVGGEGFDGLVAIGGCDKNMPGCVLAMARLDRPAVF